MIIFFKFVIEGMDEYVIMKQREIQINLARVRCTILESIKFAYINNYSDPIMFGEFLF